MIRELEQEHKTTGLFPRPAPEDLFEDFLDVGYVPSVRRGVPPGAFIPAEFVTIAPTPVTIIHQEPEEQNSIAVLVEKDATGIVRAIKVHCACGCRAMITLQYEEEWNQKSESVSTTDG